MLAGQLFGAGDAALPVGFRHGWIMRWEAMRTQPGCGRACPCRVLYHRPIDS
jgi:hypothetical protein